MNNTSTAFLFCQTHASLSPTPHQTLQRSSPWTKTKYSWNDSELFNHLLFPPHIHKLSPICSRHTTLHPPEAACTPNRPAHPHATDAVSNLPQQIWIPEVESTQKQNWRGGATTILLLLADQLPICHENWPCNCLSQNTIAAKTLQKVTLWHSP